jgi:uncharacterized protein (DUF58 family)
MRLALVSPPGRQGPGPMPGALVEPLDLLVARRAAGLLPGDRPAPGLGAGTELAQLRAYRVGDDVRRLDAAASARTGIPHVRLEIPERALTTWIVLDVSASMAFGTGARLKADVAEGVALVCGRLAVRRGGRVALVTCGAPVERLLPPAGGRRALVALRRTLEAGVAADGHAAPDALEAGLRRVARLARPHGLVVVVSDFRAAPGWERALGALGARHSLLAVEVRDAREGELPAAGRLALVDPETRERIEADTASARLRELFATAEAERADQVTNALRRARARHVQADTDGDWLRTLGRELQRRNPGGRRAERAASATQAGASR